MEPEDDITDILTKLQRAEQKLVALVPPKKATMLRSAVNMKLVAKAAKECEKVVVIVTADPAVIKLAMAAQIPVAKTLQSRPVVPTPEMVKASENEEQVIDENLEERNEKAEQKEANLAKEKALKANQKATAGANAMDLDSEDLLGEKKSDKKDPKKNKKSASAEGAGGKFDFLNKYRKFAIPGAIAAVLLIILAVWALVFAPAVDITVAMNTSASNFSEMVRFTTDKNAENIDEGIFYAEKVENEQKFETEFDATGTEERGEKAKGTVTLKYSANLILAQPKGGYTVSIPKGTQIEAGNGLKYAVVSDKVGFSWDGDLSKMPENCSLSSCTETVDVTVEATNFGPTYDVSTNTSWKPISIAAKYNNGDPLETSVSVTSKTAISGGSSKSVTIVTQADVNKAAEGRTDNSDAEGKQELMAKIFDDQITVGSVNVEVGDLKPEPAVGEEVGENTKVKLTAVTKYSIYVVEKSAVEQFINKKTEVAADQKIYSIGEPYFERFTGIDQEARLKTSIETGPTVTEEDIRAKVKGKKIGEVQSLLRSINGVSSVEVKPSFFFVRSVPKDDNKVTIKLTVGEN